MDIVEKLKTKFLEIKGAFEEDEDDEQLIYDLETEIEEAYYHVFDEKGIEQLKMLEKEVQAFKRENDFYDADTTLDFMYPDRQDEDFDEDSIW